MNKENFGEKIKFFRKQNKITQDSLATKLNVTRQAVSSWERGVTIPDIIMIEKMSIIFCISINEFVSGEFNKTNKQYKGKANTLLFIFSILIVLANITVNVLIYKEFKLFTLLPVIIVFIETIIFFAFRNAINNENYSIIAGFDSKIEYNNSTLKKILNSIENHILISSVIFINILVILGQIIIPQYIGEIIILLYTLELIGSIILINIRNHESLFKNRKDILKAKVSNLFVFFFIGLIFLVAGVMIHSMWVYHIKNNSIEALKMIGIMIPYIILTLFCFFREQKRLNGYVEKDENYRPSKLTYIAIVLCLIFLILMVIVAKSSIS